jgi:protein-tyrosine phosphatase
VRSWRAAGIDAVVSLLTPGEITELDLSQEGELCRINGMEYNSFAIPDRGLPPSRSLTLELVRKLEDRLTDGKHILVHCRVGIGRAGLVAACLLVLSGLDPGTALSRISEARACPVPDTREQREWILQWAREVSKTEAYP